MIFLPHTQIEADQVPSGDFQALAVVLRNSRILIVRVFIIPGNLRVTLTYGQLLLSIVPVENRWLA